MLLDLGRNDAGKVSKINTVKVTESFTIEKYSHVMHIVSNVVGIYNKIETKNIDVMVYGTLLYLFLHSLIRNTKVIISYFYTNFTIRM